MKLLALSLSILAFLMPMVTGLLPQQLWLWLYISIPVLLMAGFLLICLPGIRWKKKRKLIPVENEELFDHLFINKRKKHRHSF